MSSKKPQPLRTLSQPPQTPRWKPSTPHGTRAAQVHKSGGDRRKSGRVEKPWSARDILKQLSRVEADKPQPKSHLYDSSILEPTPSNKENINTTTPPRARGFEFDDDDDDEESDPARPRPSLPLSSPEEDSTIPPAPTPSVLPDGDQYQQGKEARHNSSPSSAGSNDTTIHHDQSNRKRRRTMGGEGIDEDNFTLKSIEYGRRAVMDRRSFGSIRMSDFRGGLLDEDEGVGKSPGGNQTILAGDDEGVAIGMGDDDDDGVGHEGDTEDLRLLQLRRSMSLHDQQDETTINTAELDPQDEDTFRLHFTTAAEQRRKSVMPVKLASPLHDQTRSRSGSVASQTPSISDASEAGTATPEPTAVNQEAENAAASSEPAVRRKKTLKVSKHNIRVPALPSSLIKRLGTDALVSLGRRKSRIGKDSLKALEQATEWFFEQVGEDLEAFSNHAGRKKRVSDEDVLTLMKRQRHISSMDAVPQLAKQHLPKDVLRELDLP